MTNFVFNAYTEMYFGEGQIKKLPEILERFGRKVLLVYGGGSIKRNGIYDTALQLLTDFEVYEVGGVEPNPKIESVREGAAICKEKAIDVVLPIGGGSTIDCAKVIAGAAMYDGDAWDLVESPSLIGEVLPIVTVLTMAATGSEMNKNAVISDMSGNLKLGTSSRNFIPKASVCDPTYTYSVPAIQTAAGTADIMSHVLENYFKEDKDTFVQDSFSESLLKACIKYCPIALKEPDNYEARANLMWASSMALNGLCGAGKAGAWSCHPMEHELSAYYDITHGIGLAIVTPRWMRYILAKEPEKTLPKFAAFARNVWNIDETDDYTAANKSIDALENFFISCKIPMHLNEIGIDSSKLREMAEKTVEHSNLDSAYVKLTADAVEEIFMASL